MVIPKYLNCATLSKHLLAGDETAAYTYLSWDTCRNPFMALCKAG
jgi:hypothetical protein